MKHICKASFLAALCTASAATAAPVVFEDRDAFVAATDPNAWITFNDLEPGTSFKDQTLNVGPMSLYSDAPWDGGNHIRSGAQQNTTIDGTSFVLGSVREDHPIKVDFTVPVLAWGALFKDFGNVDRHSILRFFDDASNTVGEINVFDHEDMKIEFFGIDLGGARATRMEFAVPAGSLFDNFSLDNVALTLDRGQPAPVPLPASALLLGAGVLSLTAFRPKTRV